MLRKTYLKNKPAFHALSIGKTQGKGVRYQGRYGKKKEKRDTRHNTQKQPTNPPRTCTRSLSTGGKMRGGTNREVCISHYAYHAFCYRSTGPLVLLFLCFLTTTRLTDDENQSRYDTPHKPHTAHTHTHTHGNHTAHDPRTRPTPTRSATQHTHTHTKTKEKATQGPHHHNYRTPARSGGEPRPRPSARSGEGPTTATGGGPQPGVAGPRNQAPHSGMARGQPPPHKGGPQPEVAGRSTQVPQPEVAGDPHHTPTTTTQTPAASPNQMRRGQQTTDHRHTTHTQPRTPAHAEDTPTVSPHHTTKTADNTNTQHTKQHGHRAQPRTPQTRTTRNTPTHETPHRNRQAPARSGREPHTTTAGRP